MYGPLERRFRVARGSLAAIVYGIFLLAVGAVQAAPYRLLLESNADTPGGLEIFVVTYNTFSDLLTNTQAAAAFTPLDVNSAYSVGGLAADGLFGPSPPTSAPEPGTLALLGFALAGLAATRRRKLY